MTLYWENTIRCCSFKQLKYLPQSRTVVCLLKAYILDPKIGRAHAPQTHLPVSSIAPHFNITLVTRLIYLLARIENASRGD